jgi:NitT/TauT family transport system substrate-binding protein
MRRHKSRSDTVLALALTASLAAACGGSDPEPNNSAGLEKSTIKVAMLSLVNNAPYYIAVKEKLFEAEGLTVQTQPVQQSTQAYPALKNGDIDLVFANDASLLLGHDKGDMRIALVSEGTRLTPRFMGVLVMPNSPVQTAKDLEGRSLTVHVLNNIQAITFNAVAKANGADPTKIQYRQVIFPQMAAAMQKGDVDAIHVTEPFLSDAEKKLGARLVADGGGAPVTDLPLDGYFALADWAQKNPKTAAAFQRAMRKAQELAADRTQVEEILPSYARNVDTEITKAMTLPAYPTSNSVERVQALIDLMREQGLLTNPLDAKTIVVGAS